MKWMKQGRTKQSKANIRHGREYLMHPELTDQFKQGIVMMVKWNFFIMLGMYLFYHSYPVNLASLDFTFTLMTGLFFFVWKPRMMRGKIPGYYRRDYKGMKIPFYFMKFLIIGGVIRCMIIALYYAVTLMLVQHDPARTHYYWSMILMRAWNPEMNLIGVVIFTLAVYLIFYQQKYTTIQDFSNMVSWIYSKTTLTREGAVLEFVRRRDAELEHQLMKQVRYDGNYTFVDTELSKTHYDASLGDESPAEGYEVANTSPALIQADEPVRRKSRR